MLQNGVIVPNSGKSAPHFAPQFSTNQIGGFRLKSACGYGINKSDRRCVVSDPQCVDSGEVAKSPIAEVKS